MSVALHLVLLTAAGFALTVGAASTVRVLGVDLKDKGAASSPRVLGVAAVANGLIFATVLVLYRVLEDRPLETLGFGIDPSGVVVAGGATVIAGVALAAFLRRTGGTFRSPKRGWGVLGLGIVALVLGALQEEAMFRAYFITELAPILGASGAVAISALAFTAIHLPSSKVDRWALFNWAVGGVVLGVLYLLTRSIWVVTLVHLARNVGNLFGLVELRGLGLFTPSEPIEARARTTFYVIVAALQLGLAGAVYA